MHRLSSCAAAALAACALATAARATDVRDPGAPWLTNIEMPRSTAMGGAHTAVASGNDAVLVNPAGMSQQRRYHFELDGVLDPHFGTQGLIASIVDTTTGPVGSGFMYAHWGSGGGDGRAQGWLGAIAYSYNLGSVYFGGVTKYLHFNVPLSDDAPDGTVHQFAQDLGVLVSRGGFSWGAVVQNISAHNHLLFPLTAAGGVAIGSDAGSHFALDYKADLGDTSHPKHRFAAGYEVLFDQTFVLRMGGTWDSTAGLWWASAGVGIVSEKGGIQAVFRRKLNGDFDQFFQVGFTLYLE